MLTTYTHMHTTLIHMYNAMTSGWFAIHYIFVYIIIVVVAIIYMYHYIYVYIITVVVTNLLYTIHIYT